MKALRAVVGSVLVLGAFASRSHAGVMFMVGDLPQPPAGQVRVLFSNDLRNAKLASTNNPNGLSVSFATNTLTAPSNGQDRSVSVFGGQITNLVISVAGASAGASVNSSEGIAAALLTAITSESGGGTSTSTFTYSLNPGQNFVTVTPTGGETLASLTITGAGSSSPVQPALEPTPTPSGGGAGPTVNPAPEPATLSICALGFLTMAAYASRRQRQAVRSR